jgi:hypothetical protein
VAKKNTGKAKKKATSKTKEKAADKAIFSDNKNVDGKTKKKASIGHQKAKSS